MKKIKRFLDNADVNRFRTAVQACAFVLLIFGGYLALDIGDDLPTFACPFVDGRGGTCYLYPLQHQMTAPLSGYLGGRGIGILTGFAGFLLGVMVLGKTWCGFVCPLGTLQDWMSRLRTRLGIRYSRYAPAVFGRLGTTKYLLLILLLVIPFAMGNSVFGLPRLSHDFATPYCMVCPGRTMLPLFNGDTTQLAIDFSSTPRMVLTGLGMTVTGLFLVGAFVKRRFFCLFCPMSALLHLCRKVGFLRLKKQGSVCTRCGNCHRVCDMDITEIADEVEKTDVVQSDCMMCFKCVAACPETGGLTVTYLGMPIYTATEDGYFKRMKKKETA